MTVKEKQTKYEIILTKDIEERDLIDTDLEQKRKGYQRIEITPYMGLGKDKTYQVKYELTKK